MKSVIQTPRTTTLLLILLLSFTASAGPPFLTDDPDPVPFKHREYYIASIHTYSSGSWDGTLPHLEFNYGALPHVQLHLLLPINYHFSAGEGYHTGYADTEMGMKYCFLEETDHRPQVGVFPILEVPTITNGSYSDGKMKVFLPLWLQKSFNKFTTYGGAGYWINPGSGNENSLFTGLEMQYNFSDFLTLGGELFHQTPDVTGSSPVTAFNFGGFLNFTEKAHFIFSIGHSLLHDNVTNAYVGMLWTI